MTERYVPAAGRRAFTRLYDPVVALTMREATFRGRLRAQVLDGLAPGAAVVDVGCGTGTLAIALAAGGAGVIGVDGDPEVLALARAKPGAEAVQWRKGLATALPLAGRAAPTASSCRCCCTTSTPTPSAPRWPRPSRVLRPGGRLHVADWGRPRDPLMRARGVGARSASTAPRGCASTSTARLHALLSDAGFVGRRAPRPAAHGLGQPRAAARPSARRS